MRRALCGNMDVTRARFWHVWRVIRGLLRWNMAERVCVSEPQSVQLLADNFMAAWLSSEVECASSEVLCTAERAMVSRSVELLCWYQILKVLREVANTGGNLGQQETSIINWKAILTGWSTSIESRHLSNLSVKLLKLVVLSERLKTCHKGRATSETYTEIAKLLFCISKFAEIRDTREQLTVAGLCAEAKSIEMLFMIHSDELCNGSSEKWDKRAEAFTLNTKKILLTIIRERMEIPQMFASRIEEMAKNLESSEVLDTASAQALLPVLHQQTEDNSAMKATNTEAAGKHGSQEQLPSLLPQQQQASTLEIVRKEDSGAMGQDHHLIPATEIEDETSDNQMDEAESPGAESEAAVTVDGGEEKVESSELVEVIDVDSEMNDEEEKKESDDANPLSLSGVVNRSVNVLQLPFVSETVLWSSSEGSCDLQLESEDVGNGESKRSSTSYPPLQISGGITDTSKQRMPSSSGGGGGRRVRWAEEEVEFLKEGVARFGIGNWKTIRQNYPFNSKRSNVDLRDKWRNLQKKQ